MRRRRPSLPEPSDPGFYRWMLGQPAAVIHREVCGCLRARAFLMAPALTEWTDAGSPGAGGAGGGLPLDLAFRLAHRLSGAAPLVRQGFLRFPLLPFPRLADPDRAWGVPSVESEAGLERRRVIAAFQRTLLREWWEPWPADLGLLKEYDELRAGLGEFRRLERSLWLRLGLSAGAEGSVQVAGRSYPLPRKTRYARDLRAPRRRVAALLLAQREGTSRTRLEARLQRARVARPCDQAWTDYVAWVMLDAQALAELHELLLGFPRILAPLARAIPAGPPA